MDTLQSTTDDESKLLQIYKDAYKLFNETPMLLQEWKTNSSSLTPTITTNYLQKLINEETKVLRYIWSTSTGTKTDKFHVSPVTWTTVQTKSKMFSTSSKIYDHLGLVPQNNSV